MEKERGREGLCHGLWIAHHVGLGGYLDKINAATNFLDNVSKVTFFGEMCFYYLILLHLWNSIIRERIVVIRR